MLGMLQDPVTGEQLGQAPRTQPHARSSTTSAARARPPQDRRRFRPHLLRPQVRLASRGRSPTTPPAPASTPPTAAPSRPSSPTARARSSPPGLGKGGVVQEDIRGIVATAFDHWDSRAGDPQLHTHVVVLNRVQAVSDGKWRTLDSKALFRAAVGMSELYNGVLADELTADLGWAWTPEQRRRSAEPKWEVDGVPQGPARALLPALERDRDRQGRPRRRLRRLPRPRSPPPAKSSRLRQQATLATREDKHVRPLRDLITEWTRPRPPFRRRRP